MYVPTWHVLTYIVHAQQERVIAEIKTNSNNPYDLVTIQFLEALHYIFECGLLSKERVFTNEADPLCCMQTGFKSWCDECYKEGTAIVLCSSVVSCVFILFNTHLVVYTCMCMICVLSCLHSCLILNPLFFPHSRAYIHTSHTFIYIYKGGNPKDDTQTINILGVASLGFTEANYRRFHWSLQ